MTDKETAAAKVTTDASEAADAVVAHAADVADSLTHEASDVADRIVTEASDVAGRVVTEASDVAGRVVTEASDVADRMVTEASDVADRVLSLAAGTADQVTNTAVDAAGEVVTKASDVAERVVTLAAGEAVKIQFQAAGVAQVLAADAATARRVITEAAETLTKHVSLLTGSLLQSIKATDDLGDRLEDHNERIEALRTSLDVSVKYGKRTRILMTGTATSLIVSVCLTIGLSFALHRANNATSEAHSLAMANQTTLVANCVAGDMKDLQQVALLDEIVAVLGKSPALATTLAKDRAAVATTYAPRNCVLLANGTLPPVKAATS